MIKRTILFSKVNALGIIISLLVVALLIGATIYRGGFNLGIDFKSGQNIVASVPGAAAQKDVAESLEAEFPGVIVTHVNNSADKTFNIKITATESEQGPNVTRMEALLKARFGESVVVLSSAFMDSTLSQNLFRSALVLTAIAILLIFVYVGLRFKFRFALAAISSLVYDVLFIVSVIGAFGMEVTTTTIAAVLTIIGYSLNDTIVIFDRIRENLKLMNGASFSRIADTSITVTLSRTFITAFTTLLAVLALYFFATGDVQAFASVMLIGVIEGIWSTIFIATPMLYVLGFTKIVAADAGAARPAFAHPQRIDAPAAAVSRGEEGDAVAASGSGFASGQPQTHNTFAPAAAPDINTKAARIREEILKHRKKK